MKFRTSISVSFRNQFSFDLVSQMELSFRGPDPARNSAVLVKSGMYHDQDFTFEAPLSSLWPAYVGVLLGARSRLGHRYRYDPSKLHCFIVQLEPEYIRNEFLECSVARSVRDLWFNVFGHQQYLTNCVSSKEFSRLWKQPKTGALFRYFWIVASFWQTFVT